MKIKQLHFKTIFCSVLIALLCSCASTYKNIYPDKLNYQNKSITDSVKILYQYDVLKFRKNRKNYKREYNQDLKLIAIKIENQTKDTLSLIKDLELTISGEKLIPISDEEVFRLLRQRPFLYSFFILGARYTWDSNGNSELKIGLSPIGLIYLTPNIIIASNSNSDFKSELYTFSPNNCIIPPEDIGYALICNSLSKNHKIKLTKIKGEKVEELTNEDNVNEEIKMKSKFYFESQFNSFDVYYQNLKKYLENDPLVSSVQLSRKEYKNGNTKFIGLEILHKYNNNLDDYYKIGTWRYFHENGKLKKVIDYDFNEKKSGRYQLFDKNGVLIKEKEYNKVNE